MNSVIDFLTVQHDLRLILAAGATCCIGLAAALTLIKAARGTGWSRRGLLYAVGGSAVGGLTAWATYFLAILAYRFGSPVAYDPGIVFGTLGLAMAGVAVAVLATLNRTNRLRRMTAMTVVAVVLIAVHFLGLHAAVIQGARLVLTSQSSILATTLALGMAMMVVVAGGVAPSRLQTAMRTVGWMGFLGSLHFVSMAFLVLLPDPNVRIGAGLISSQELLTCLLVAATAVVSIAACVFGVAHWSRKTALSQLREAIEAMPDGLAFYDAEDRLIIWNERYAQVNPELAPSLKVGRRFEDMVRIGMTFDHYLDAKGREAEWLEERMALRRAADTVQEQHLAGDQWLRVQDRRTPGGGTVTVANDITDLKRDARALAEARDLAETAARAKAAFLANMSHEIRTPLNGVIGVAQALARTELTAEQADMLSLIQSSSQTLQTLLSDILDLARVESGRVEIGSEPFDLSQAVREAAQLYATAAAEKGLGFFVDVDPQADRWIEGDVVRVKQILTNLVSNAVKFTHQGFVSLTVSSGMGIEGLPVLRFTIEDTGVGFDAAARERLFNRFEQADGSITRRFGGTGLGLAICRQLAEMMGGELDCESEPGGGSVFILTLPLIPATAPEITPVAEVVQERIASTARPKVLLADDHPTNRRVVELVLAQTDVDLTSVEDGAQALAAFRAAHFDLILMDMQMPVMDGLTATREIRLHEALTAQPPTTIVMLTANALAEHVAASRAAGADHHLAKPFNAVDLLSLVAGLGDDGQDTAAA